jgi:hypothetical protein
LKNFTIVDGTYNSGNETHTEIVECKYFVMYFYLFSNKTIKNEHPMPGMIGAEWNHTDDITAPPKPAMLSSNDDSYILASNGGVDITIYVDGYDDTSGMIPVLVLLGVVSVVFVVTLYMYRHTIMTKLDSVMNPKKTK